MIEPMLRIDENGMVTGLNPWFGEDPSKITKTKNSVTNQRSSLSLHHRLRLIPLWF